MPGGADSLAEPKSGMKELLPIWAGDSEGRAKYPGCSRDYGRAGRTSARPATAVSLLNSLS
jgi:hypothetical protein